MGSLSEASPKKSTPPKKCPWTKTGPIIGLSEKKKKKKTFEVVTPKNREFTLPTQFIQKHKKKNSDPKVWSGVVFGCDFGPVNLGMPIALASPPPMGYTGLRPPPPGGPLVGAAPCTPPDHGGHLGG